jgi:hypothetical protein
MKTADVRRRCNSSDLHSLQHEAAHQLFLCNRHTQQEGSKRPLRKYSMLSDAAVPVNNGTTHHHAAFFHPKFCYLQMKLTNYYVTCWKYETLE